MTNSTYQASIHNLGSTDEQKQIKRLCRAVVLRAMIDALHYELNGTIPAYAVASKASRELVYEDAKRFIFSKDCEVMCRNSRLPIEKVRGMLCLKNMEAKRAALHQLDQAYDAIMTSGLR